MTRNLFTCKHLQSRPVWVGSFVYWPLNTMQSEPHVSPPAPQSPEAQGLTGASSSTGKSKNQELVSGMFSELENDPDFMLIAERWAELSEELRRAIIRMVK